MPTEGSTSEIDPISSVVLVLSIAVVLSYALEFGNFVDAYPTWLYLSSITVPTVTVAPTVLSLAVLAKRVREFRDNTRHANSLGLLLLAVATVGTSCYALIDLNTGRGGVFWAGIPVVVFGGILAVAVFISIGLDIGR